MRPLDRSYGKQVMDSWTLGTGGLVGSGSSLEQAGAGSAPGFAEGKLTGNSVRLPVAPGFRGNLAVLTAFPWKTSATDLQ